VRNLTVSCLHTEQSPGLFGDTMKPSDFKHLNFGGIYCITNKLTNKIYVGQAINIHHRIKEHFRSSKDPRRSYYHLYTAITESGWNNFQIRILEKTNAAKNLNDREAFWIITLNSIHPNGYNSTNPFKRYKKYLERVLKTREHRPTHPTQGYI